MTNPSKLAKRAQLLGTILLTGSLCTPAFAEADANNLEYQDLFNIEYAANPVVMPNNQAVIYERRSMDIMTDSLRRNLWTVDLTGKRHMPLLSDSNNHYSPVFSHDGSKMAYLSSKEGKVQIYLRDMETGNTARVTDVQMSPGNMSF